LLNAGSAKAELSRSIDQRVTQTVWRTYKSLFSLFLRRQDAIMLDTQTRDSVLSNQVIKLISIPLRKIHVSLPSWMSIIAFELFTLIASSVLWALANMKPRPSIISYLWASWGALIAGIIVALVEWNLDNFLRITHEMLPLLEKMNHFDEWKRKRFNLKSQLIFSFIFATVIFPTTYSFFTFTIGRTMINWGSLFLYINLLLIGNGFYWLVFLPGATRVLTDSMSNLRLFDPKNTFWVNQLANIFSRAASSASLIGVLIIIPVVFGPQIKDINIITTAWLLLVWALVLIPYLVAQKSITEFINKERLEKLTEIQNEICKFLDGPPTSESEKRIENLTVIYGKALDAKSSAFGINPQIVNSLILPLLSFALINSDKISTFLQSLTR
jgi:hypothetical protein